MEKKTLAKVVSGCIVAGGFLICAYSGGILSLWALFCVGLTSFVFGLYCADFFKGESNAKN